MPTRERLLIYSHRDGDPLGLAGASELLNQALDFGAQLLDLSPKTAF